MAIEAEDKKIAEVIEALRVVLLAIEPLSPDLRRFVLLAAGEYPFTTRPTGPCQKNTP
jgi:hypothetical protein